MNAILGSLVVTLDQAGLDGADGKRAPRTSGVVSNCPGAYASPEQIAAGVKILALPVANPAACSGG